MDFNLLRSWLDLPAGPWPPDHYTLLGWAPGRYDAAQIETRVLERMDRLRSHQLMHPEVVTEGMNRLAQALITLTDPAGKAAYDRDLQTASGVRKEYAAGTTAHDQGAYAPRSPAEESVVVAAPVFDDDIFSDDAQTTEPVDSGEVTRIIEWRPEVPPPDPATGTATYEVLAEDPGTAVLPPPSLPYEDVAGPPPEPLSLDADDRPVVPTFEVPASAELDQAALAAAADWLTSRRRLYAQLALIRSARRVWQALGPILGNPDDPVDRPVRVLILVEAVAAVRPLLDRLRGLIGGVGEPGGLVAAVIRQPLLLDTFRRLLPMQRTAVAIDWKQADKQLMQEYARLRQLVRQNRERRGRTRSGLAIARLIGESPEVLLVVLAAMVLIVALFRTATGR